MANQDHDSHFRQDDHCDTHRCYDCLQEQRWTLWKRLVEERRVPSLMSLYEFCAFLCSFYLGKNQGLGFLGIIMDGYCVYGVFWLRLLGGNLWLYSFLLLLLRTVIRGHLIISYFSFLFSNEIREHYIFSGEKRWSKSNLFHIECTKILLQKMPCINQNRSHPELSTYTCYMHIRHSTQSSEPTEGLQQQQRKKKDHNTSLWIESSYKHEAFFLQSCDQ